ncbi:MAG: hypothetical protein JRF59_11690 [Deltaproteobacteria bacterium]|nr:hypothetical protein [Deltaproteobacteria bacterium]MBW1924695.1 hypothetical protein [Deltaproteobacteria bacterium]MBW1948870.1 hypothetical protein [Deltaproteobacteria bacterium]MBW2006717.1 hypothetical protein [Deltaproteobacteria bacterium]MBW2348489.1 hypothetical protein [Deltaproteobacteria bacterium]
MMGKGPKDPMAVAEAFCGEARGIYGEDLVSVVLYGSAAGAGYRPGRSDVNLMVVLSERAVDRLDRALPLVRKWRNKGVAVPLFLTPAYLETSMDVFPLEYLGMKRAYRVVYGKDPLAGLRFEPRFVRLQCEREIKGKLLLLRESYLENEGKPRFLERVLVRAVPSLLAIFQGLLFLKGAGEATGGEEAVRAASLEFELDEKPFLALLNLKKMGARKADASPVEIYMGILGQLRKLAQKIDVLGGEDD